MIPHDKLAARLRQALATVDRHGALMWQRADDWHTAGRMEGDSTRGGGSGGAASDTQLEDILGNAAAARYYDELDKLTRRLDDDLHRLCRLKEILCPDKPRQLGSVNMLAEQVASDGWCVSCWRDDQHLQPISTRPDGTPYYTDLCRACGEWKAEHGQLPPLEVLKVRHGGGRVRVRAS